MMDDGDMSSLGGTVIMPSTLFCFICHRKGDSNDQMTTFADLFNSQFNTSEALLSDTLSTMLGRQLTHDTVHSRSVCEDCLNLCTEFDALQSRMDIIKMHVIQSYNDTIENYCIDSNASDAEQLDESQIFPVDADHDVADPIANSEVDDEADTIISELDATQSSVMEHEVQEFIIQGQKVMLIKQPSRRKKRNSPSTSGTGPNAAQRFEVSSTATRLDTDLTENDVLAIKDGTNANQTDAELLNELEATNMVEIRTEADDDCMNDFIDGPLETEEADGHEVQTNDSQVNVIQDMMVGTANSNCCVEMTTDPLFTRDGATFRCLLCSSEQVFDNRTIITHMKTDHNERVYVCDLCGTDFRKKAEITEHLEQHAKNSLEVNFECSVCKRVFSSLRLFRIHRRIHVNNPKTWLCKFCNKMYSTKKLLEEHKNMHTGDRPYKCTDCPKDFASKYTLNAHMKIHSERKRPFACKICPKTFYSFQNQMQHERTHTGVKEHVCKDCNKAFGTLHNLEVHRVVHTGFKPFLCRMCGKAFARRAEIKDHERTHTGERPYACDLCDATFAQRSNLSSHKRATHLNDKRYKCDQCGKSFKRRRLLDYHHKACHTGERPFTCDVCGSTFVYPEHFKKHVRIHTGAKPYQCEVCGKAFNSRDNRNAHRFVHSDKKPYECLTCAQGFMRKPMLLAHMKIFNHESKRIVLNQPRIVVEGEEDVKPVIQSNVVFVEEALEDEDVIFEGHIDEDEEDLAEVHGKPMVKIEETQEDVIDGEVLAGDSMHDNDETEQVIETEDGQVRMVKIRLPDTNEVAWVNIVGEE